MALGKRIREERDARGLTQIQLCELVNALIPDGALDEKGEPDKGLSQQNLLNLEKRDSAKNRHAHLIAAALGLSLRWLLTGEGPKHAAQSVLIADLLPGLNVALLEKLSPTERSFIAGKIDNEVEKLLAKHAQADQSGKEWPTTVESQADVVNR